VPDAAAPPAAADLSGLDTLFAPAAVAVVGAGRDPMSVGAVVMRNLLTGGFKGPVMPVNPKAQAIEGVLAYPDIASLPAVPDLAVVCTPARVVPDVVRALGEKGAQAAVIISAGFSEAGEEGRARQAETVEVARSFGMRLIGPNCVGVIAPGAALNASFAHRQAPAGGIGFLSQSGAVLTSVLDWAADRGIGFSVMTSMGAMADIDFGDMIAFLAQDDDTRAILIYAEQITDAPKFMAAARAAAQRKPVIAIKPGRHAEAAEAAFSHTGALAGADAVYDAAFRRAGVLRVNTLDGLFEAAEILARDLTWRGERLAVLTNGGGAGVLSVDSLMDRGGRLAQLAPETIEALNGVLPVTWSHGNPVDIIGDAPGRRYADALKLIQADPGVDAVLALNCPTAIADSDEAAKALLDVRDDTPLITCWLGEGAAQPARERFEAAGVPTYDTPVQAVRAFSLVAGHHRALAAAAQAPAAEPTLDPARIDQARTLVAQARARGEDRLGEVDAKTLLDLFEIPVVPTRVAETPEAAAALADALGYPAAVKIISPDISHKTDSGGVALDLKDREAVRAAAEKMLQVIPTHEPDAHLEGFAVQPMASMPGSHELIAGLVSDRVFGPVVLFGHGGTAVEVISDKALGLPPLNRPLVEDMMSRTRIHRLLLGYRDRKPADIDAVARVLIRLGDMARALPEVVELDINPLWANPDGVLALDARVRLGEPGAPAALD